LFKNTAEDRYLYEEEIDVTEIYFIARGDWAIGFNSFHQMDSRTIMEEIQVEDDFKGPKDMM